MKKLNIGKVKFTYEDFTPEQLAGLKGPAGTNGLDGITPNIQIGTVTTLEPNQQATVENVGTKEEPIFNFGIPKGEAGAGSSGRKLVTRYVHNSNKVIQPTALDLGTGIFTCESTEGIDGAVVGVGLNASALYKPTYIPKEFFEKLSNTSNYELKIIVKSETTFLLSYQSQEITSYPNASNTSVDVTKFHFEVLDTPIIQLENFEIKNDYEVRVYGYLYDKLTRISGFGTIVAPNNYPESKMYMFPTSVGAVPCNSFNFKATRNGNLLCIETYNSYVNSYASSAYTTASRVNHNYIFNKQPLTFITIDRNYKGAGLFNGFTIEIYDLGGADNN